MTAAMFTKNSNALKTDGPRARPFAFPADRRQAVGWRGEEIAATWLTRQGYAVRARRCRIAGVEIDIVASLGSLTVLVEVKTKSDESFGIPEEEVGPFKRRRLRTAAMSFASETGREVRIDVIAVILPAQPGQPVRLRHLPGAVGEDD